MEEDNRDSERRVWGRAKKDLHQLSLLNRKKGKTHLSEEIYLFCKFMDNEMGIAYEDWRKVYTKNLEEILNNGE